MKFTLQLQHLQQYKVNFNLQIVTKTEVLQQKMKDDEKLAKLLITERKINVSKTISIILKEEPETWNCKRSWLLTTHALLKESHNCAELQIEAR